MRPLSCPPSRSSRLAAVALAGALSLGLAACSSSGDSGASSGAGGAADGPVSSEAQAGPDAPDTGTGGDDAARSATSSGGGAAVDTVVASVADRKLSRRADVSLRVDDVAAAAARLRQVASAAGGLVVAEQVSTDADGPRPIPRDDGTTSTARPTGWGTVTISVPTAKLDTTLDAVAEVGTVLSRQTSTDDVTGQYVDTSSRVASMKASVARVRALMTKAERLSDIVALEGELSRRQADLEALEQQLASLDDRVALAPISVQLSTAGTPVPAKDPTGFVAGLTSGWEAFTTSVRLVLTLVGALVPFAVAALLVLGPLGWWWRRRPRALPTTPSGPSPAA